MYNPQPTEKLILSDLFLNYDSDTPHLQKECSPVPFALLTARRARLFAANPSEQGCCAYGLAPSRRKVSKPAARAKHPTVCKRTVIWLARYWPIFARSFLFADFIANAAIGSANK